jgi:hypothetical protein
MFKIAELIGSTVIRIGCEPINISSSSTVISFNSLPIGIDSILGINAPIADKATETKKTYIKMTTKALLAKILGISMFGYLVGIALQ